MTAHQPIGDYGIIGDGRSAALVSTAGSIDWLCWPRFDSPSILGRLLDAERGGHWRIAPAEQATARRRYVGETNVLETRFQSASGEVVLTDFMPVASEEEKRRQLWPEHELLRTVTCERGGADLLLEFVPRLDYGRRPSVVRDKGALGYRIEDSAALITLRSEAALQSTASGLTGRIRLRAGEAVSFSLSYATDGPAVVPPLGEAVSDKLRLTVDWWNEWAKKCQYDGPYRDLILRSALVLKLLSFAPSGAIVAAATTSLPETIGGDLSWDYRYCWLRDAAFTMRAFLALGYHEEAAAFLSWLLHATRLTHPRLQVLYDVYGRQPPKETELDHLSGYANSRPVRVGNAAQRQLQLDVYGEVVDAAAAFAEAGHRLDRETQRILVGFGKYVCAHWREPDSGIWEARGERKHYTHSRLMCWVALDRLLAMHRDGRIQRAPIGVFSEQSQRIAEHLREHGWNATLNTYMQTLDGDELDASALLMALHGFEKASSQRMAATAQRLRTQLGCDHGLLYRNEASPASGEGAFVMCSFWLADFLARGGGSLDEADQVFRATTGFANELGLLAEEVDPPTGAALGNFPQAFSHIGLIQAAVSISRHERNGDPDAVRRSSTGGVSEEVAQ